MKMLITVYPRFVFTALLLSLIFLVSCKQSDTYEQAQVAEKTASSSVVPTLKPTKKESPASKLPSGSGLAPNTPAKAVAVKQKPKVAVTVKKINALPATAAVSDSKAEDAAKKTALQKPKAALPTFGPDDPRSGIYLSITGKMARMGDPSGTASDAYKYGKGSHAEALAGVGLPKDKFGLIDWVRIVNKGIIKPRGSIKPGVPELPPFDMNVLITAKGDFVNDVLFPHKAHTYWLKCENCHTGIFIMAKGKNKMTMQGIVEGKWCGRCHGKVAFPLTDCNRCHQTPKQIAAEVATKK